MTLPEQCVALAELQVRRKFYIKCANRQTNAAGALVRRALGWRFDAEEKEAGGIKKRAARIVSVVLAGKEQAKADADLAGALAGDLAVMRQALEPLQKARHQIELEMQRIVRKLAVAPWAKGVRGLGELGVAVIVGEAGDLSKYANPEKLWKRLGLAPLNGKACSTWRREGGLTAEDWTELGYSPRRRAEMYAVIAEPLFRSQTPVNGPYRQHYDLRRARTAETHPDWSKLHSHQDALRIMTKQLILDLWSEWRRGQPGCEALPIVDPPPILSGEPIHVRAAATVSASDQVIFDQPNAA